MNTLEIIKYAGGGFILIAGTLLGYIFGRGHESRRKTRAYNRQQAQLPRATKRN